MCLSLAGAKQDWCAASRRPGLTPASAAVLPEPGQGMSEALGRDVRSAAGFTSRSVWFGVTVARGRPRAVIVIGKRGARLCQRGAEPRPLGGVQLFGYGDSVSVILGVTCRRACGEELVEV
jgi:hypothetical protein